MKLRLYFTLTSCLLIFLSGLGIFYYAGYHNSCNRTLWTKTKKSNSEVFETNGLKHNIDLAKIKSFGIPEGKIPALNEPELVSISQANKVFSDSIQGIGLEVNGEARFYPIQIVLWHNIINDCINGKPVVISFCPLCLTSVVYNRKIGTHVLEFENKGKTYEDSFVISDKQTNSEWSTLFGEAITGKETGTLLEIIPSTNVTFGNWKNQYPDTKVLSINTGYKRPYNINPYSNQNIFDVLKDATDDAVNPKELVVGVNVEGASKAYPIKFIDESIITDSINGKEVNISKNSKGEIQVFTNLPTEEPEAYDYLISSWLIWNNVYPESLLYLR